ncbi:hypothetical protein [Nocardia flavorosea]|uniref:hypothetical protein n=1 Tax=Nocardia flavorosea TaxID=53429 RepID=UPI002454D6C3|nr:hypothetical protein [Nocardia flavorosea]
MGSGEQFGLDLGVPVERTEWGKWVDPERHRAQARKFMDRAAIAGIPSAPWPEDSAEVQRLNSIVGEIFPDMATAMAPENADVTDAFVCFLGECFAKFAGARWVEWDWPGPELTFYEHVNPALLCDTEDEDEITAWALVDDMINHHRGEYAGMFSYIAAVLREYAADHAEKRREESASTS